MVSIGSLCLLGTVMVTMILLSFILFSEVANEQQEELRVFFKDVYAGNNKTVSSTPLEVAHVNPSPITNNIQPSSRRLLFMTASYTFDQFHSLQKVLDCMRDICNAGWEVSVLIDSASGLNYSHPRYVEIQDRSYCIRTGQPIPIVIEEYGKIGFGLNAKHRQYMTAHLNEFDYFSYAEEDMLLTVSHLTAVVTEQEKLKKYLVNDWIRYFIGFIR